MNICSILQYKYSKKNVRKLNRKCFCNLRLEGNPTKTSSGVGICARKARYRVFLVNIRKTVLL